MPVSARKPSISARRSDEFVPMPHYCLLSRTTQVSAMADVHSFADTVGISSRNQEGAPQMDDSWRARLQGILDRDGRSMRDVSLSAGLSAGYLHGILKGGKDSTIDRIAAIADALNVSLAYILIGLEVSPETEKLISLLQSDPASRDAVLQLLRARDKA
jgi:transcriptional regulator with XRE-family HTH domain